MITRRNVVRGAAAVLTSGAFMSGCCASGDRSFAAATSQVPQGEGHARTLARTVRGRRGNVRRALSDFSVGRRAWRVVHDRASSDVFFANICHGRRASMVRRRMPRR